MDEMKNAELTDEELGGVAGGRSEVDWNGKHYKWDGYVAGPLGTASWDLAYLCPNCGRPVHYGNWCRYYCDPCDESWFYEDKLIPNIEAGMWKEVS